MTDRLDELHESIRTFVRERNWEQFHDPKNLSMALASETGEVLDIFRWMDNDEADRVREDEETMERIEDEIGDVALCLLMLCDRLDVDLLEAAEQKLETNCEKYPVDEVRAEPADEED
jgi:NTP pyrophosphatase (non-canonical NTP hydrolase)